MKYIACIDVETTGLNSQLDYIIQLSACKMDKESMEVIDTFNYYIKPIHKFEISPSAEAVHHISTKFIMENGVPLKDIIDDFLKFIDDCDYLTYNGNKFDIKFLIKDFKLVGYEFPIENRLFYDAFAMECRLNPRDLQSVYKKYTGEGFEGAHDSLEDVKATCEVFKQQLTHHKLTLDEISQWDENIILFPEDSIRNAALKGEPMKLVFKIGKYKDSELYHVCKTDPMYLKWWAQSVAAPYTRKIVYEYLKKCKEKECMLNI